MPTKRYKSSIRYKLSSSTPDEVAAVLEQHNYSLIATAQAFGVTRQALSQWLRRNNYRRVYLSDALPKAKGSE